MPAAFLNPYILVLVGGALGSLLRYYAAVFLGARPATTFCVNITGSFSIGLLAAVADDPRIRLLLGTGVLGGFTTFSAWQLEALQAARLEGGSRAAVLILFGSLAAGFLACWIGYYFGEKWKH